MKLTSEQRKKAFKHLMEVKESIVPSKVIKSPATKEYYKRTEKRYEKKLTLSYDESIKDHIVY